jgi:hypothetical protein
MRSLLAEAYMFEAINIAASGMDAAGAILSSALSGNTVLLQQVPGSSNGGVEIERIVVNPHPDPATSPEIDPVAEAIDIRKAQVLYAANAAVISAQEQMFGSLIDVLDTEASQPPDVSSVQ